MVTLHHLSIGVLLIFNFSVFSCDPFTSVASLTELIRIQNRILGGIREYQQIRLHELGNLQRLIEDIHQEHVKASKDPEEYLSNPINAFNLIKRIAYDWTILHDFVESANSTEDFGREWSRYLRRLKLPNKYDLQNAIQGFVKAENDFSKASSDVVYLNTNACAKVGITLSLELTWDECYEIGFALYNKRDYLGALLWLEQALEKVKDTPDYNEMLRADIVEYMAYSHYMLGNNVEAVSAMKQLIGVPFLGSTIIQSMEYFQLKKKAFVQNIALGEPRVLSL